MKSAYDSGKVNSEMYDCHYKGLITIIVQEFK